MTKVEFIDNVAGKSGVGKKDVTAVYDAIWETIEEVFKAEDSVRTPIGTFTGYTRETGERVARNPKDGSVIKVPARKYKGYPKFKPAKGLKVEE